MAKLGGCAVQSLRALSDRDAFMKFARHEYLTDEYRVDTVWWATLKVVAVVLTVPAVIAAIVWFLV